MAFKHCGKQQRNICPTGACNRNCTLCAWKLNILSATKEAELSASELA